MLRREKAKKIFKAAIVLGVFAVFLFSFSRIVLAQGAGDLGLSQVEPTLAIATQTDIRVIIARVIEAALGLVGIVLVVLVIYAGVLYMTSADDAAKKANAKKILINAAIGLLIILSSLAITEFVIRSLQEALFGGPTGLSGVKHWQDPLSGSLGNGIIQDHYPARNAVGIPRNTKIIVTFKEPMDIATLISGDKLNLDNVKIRKTADSKDSGPFVSAFADATDDQRTFVFRPEALLGSSLEDVSYTVALLPGIKKATGEQAFGTNFPQGYQWEFKTGTFVDETPPKVETVSPAPDVTYSRNVAVEVTFNEPVDPLTVSGVSPAFGNLKITAGGAPIPGAFNLSNGYRTVSFLSNNECGKNSCGEAVFCLPPNSAIVTLLRAATLSASPPAAGGAYPYDGVTDVCGNSLDGGGGPVPPNAGPNGKADGPPVDNYSWGFNTSANIDLTPPQITAITPDAEQGGWAVSGPVDARFSKKMLSSSLTNSNIVISGAATPDYEKDSRLVPWWSVNMTYVDANFNPTTISTEAMYSVAHLPHGEFLRATEPDNISYYPEVTAGVKDIYQNCFLPPVSTATGGACVGSLGQPYCCGTVACDKPCKFGASGAPVCQ